jgi:nucleoside-diphosphate-sugar epimerase
MTGHENIFITGFPGFIAHRLVRALMKENRSFTLLVEGRFREAAEREVQSICSQLQINNAAISIVEGDITKPNLGLDRQVEERIKFETNSVFHLAAIYDLNVSRDLAMKVNVEGTRNVNSFVRSLKNLTRYNYISTCYVAGCREGTILETELRHSAGFRNHYEETKYLAEIEVEQLKGELPVTIYRPSVVCGDSKTGETSKFDGVYYLIHYLRRHPKLLSMINIGNEDVRLNLVPVDFVVESIERLSQDSKAEGKTVHIADPSPLTTSELFEIIARSLGGMRPLIKVPKSVVHSSLTLSFSPKLTGLPRAGVPYFFIEQSYDTSISMALLRPYGISCPRFSDYVDALLNFVETQSH